MGRNDIAGIQMSRADREMRALEGLEDLARYGVEYVTAGEGLWAVSVRGDDLPPMGTDQVHAFLLGAEAIQGGRDV